MTTLDAFWLTVWALFSALYLGGWWRLRRRGARRLANWTRLAVAGSALAAGFFVFWPWTTAQTHRSFLMHMVEHEVLIEISPILLWLARPLPFWLWALPASWRRRVIGWSLAPGSRGYALLRRWTRPRWIVPLYLIVVTVWHLPRFVDATMVSAWWHTVERATLLFAAFLFWWLVLAAFPRWHAQARSPRTLLYVVGAYAQNEILGLGLTLMRRPVYDFYEVITPPWGLSPLADQALGGATMWIPGEMIYAVVIMGLLMRLLEEPRPYRGVYEVYS